MQPGLLILVFGLVCLGTKAQVNLIQNHSFEDTLSCPTDYNQLWRVPPWVKVGGDGGISLLHTCAPNSCACYLPQEESGYQYPHSGNGLVTLINKAPNGFLSFHAEPNFLGQYLIAPLIAGRLYKLQFYVSLADSCCLASRNIGAYFSTGQPIEETSFLLSLDPQIHYNGDYLTNKTGWTKIQGNYIAQGGENFITIGNFHGDANTDTIYVGNCGVPPNNTTAIYYWYWVYYYIDDVSVTEVDTTQEYEEAEEVREPNEAVGVGEQLSISNYQLSIWPNPVSESLMLNVQDLRLENLKLTVTDMLGRAKEVEFTEAYEGTMQAKVGHLASGVYLLSASGKDGRVWRTEFLKE